MLVSFRHRLVLLAMPKCASTALESALADQMDVVISGHPSAKHTPFRKYDRFLRRYCETFTSGPLEVVSLIREPIDWLGSWWRYRGREGLNDPSRSTRGWSFDEFAEAYLAGRPGPASVGSQARFVSGKDGGIGVDRLFRYEAVGELVSWLEARLEMPIALARENVSPSPGAALAIRPDLRSQLELALEQDYRLWRGADGSERSPG